MIKLKVKETEYTISQDLIVSSGPAKEYIEDCINLIRSDYKLWHGFFEPYLYVSLYNFKSIQLVSIDYKKPNKNVIY